MPSNDNTPPVNDGTDAGDENPTPSAPTSSIVELSWPADNIYAQPDSPDLIVFDADDDLTGLPRIKYATLEKLIERVTYAKYPGTHIRRHLAPIQLPSSHHPSIHPPIHPSIPLATRPSRQSSHIAIHTHHYRSYRFSCARLFVVSEIYRPHLLAVVHAHLSLVHNSQGPARAPS